MTPCKPTKKISVRESQEADRSYLDPNIPLGFPGATLVTERGPATVDYYRKKHARGEYGSFWPLHVVQFQKFGGSTHRD